MQQKCLDFIKPFADSLREGAEVLDVGSLDVNGTFKPLFHRQKYIGSDIVAGNNVDVVQPSHDELPFEKERFDAVISGNMLEHCEDPKAIIEEMVHVLKVGGRLAIIAPWKMDHHYAPDRWRFSPDGFMTLVKDLPLRIITCDWAPVYYDYEIGTYLEAEKL